MLFELYYKCLYIKNHIDDSMKIKMTFDGYRCLRCGKEWVPKMMGTKPTVCPKCHSPYWNKPRINKRKVID